jgi:hypothetical protein
MKKETRMFRICSMGSRVPSRVAKIKRVQTKTKTETAGNVTTTPLLEGADLSLLLMRRRVETRGGDGPPSAGLDTPMAEALCTLLSLINSLSSLPVIFHRRLRGGVVVV